MRLVRREGRAEAQVSAAGPSGLSDTLGKPPEQNVGFAPPDGGSGYQRGGGVGKGFCSA